MADNPTFITWVVAVPFEATLPPCLLLSQNAPPSPVAKDTKKIIKRRNRTSNNPKRTKVREGVDCHWCGVTETTEWRRGPENSVLCNACGLQYAKIKRMKKANHEEKPAMRTVDGKLPITFLLN